MAEKTGRALTFIRMVHKDKPAKARRFKKFNVIYFAVFNYKKAAGVIAKIFLMESLKRRKRTKRWFETLSRTPRM